MNSLAIASAPVTRPPGLPLRSRMIDWAPALSAAARAPWNWVAAASPNWLRLIYATLPAAREFVATCSRSKTSRMTEISRRCPARSICRVAFVPFAPLINALAWSMVRPSRVVPFTETRTSPALTPALSAGDPGIGSTTASWQPPPILVHSCVLAGSTGSSWTCIPTPTAWPPTFWSVFWKSAGAW